MKAYSSRGLVSATCPSGEAWAFGTLVLWSATSPAPSILLCMGDTTSAYRENRTINVIRSVSALLVVFGHVRLLLFQNYADTQQNPVSALLYAFTSLGSEAVIVFFVLSGYWVGGAVISKLRSGEFTWAGYASSRLSRLWIVLVPALVLTFIVDQAGRSLFSTADIYAKTSSYSGVPDDPNYSLLALLGNLVFVQSIHVSEFGLNKPLWSLAYEFWYYAMFPALLTAFWKGGGKTFRLAGALVFTLSVVIAGPNVLLLFPAWLAGAAVAFYGTPIRRILDSIPPRTLAMLRVAGIIGTILAMVASHEIAMLSRLGAWIIGIAAALLLCLFASDVTWKGKCGRALNRASRTAHFSYSLYATHMPLVAFFAAAFVPSVSGRWHLDFVHATLGLAVIAALLVVAYYFAAGTEFRTEQLRSWLLSRRQPRKTQDTVGPNVR